MSAAKDFCFRWNYYGKEVFTGRNQSIFMMEITKNAGVK
jgi:hypothetical protein